MREPTALGRAVVITTDEARALEQLFATLDRAGDPKVLLRCDAVRGLRRKCAMHTAGAREQEQRRAR